MLGRITTARKFVRRSASNDFTRSVRRASGLVLTAKGRVWTTQEIPDLNGVFRSLSRCRGLNLKESITSERMQAIEGKLVQQGICHVFEARVQYPLLISIDPFHLTDHQNLTFW